MIPENAAEENIQAEYKDGILILSLMKKPEAQVRKRKDIEVK